jgi:uncharacterized protein (TIGR02996 family)
MPSVTNPDIDAFLRKYLERPSDATARLVFADWLEETGEPHSIAWAHYIRLKAAADRYPHNNAARYELDRHAGQYATQIRARLTVPAKLFVGYPKSLLQLLPETNITVRIGRFRPAPSVVAQVNEEDARSIPILPLDDRSGALIVAHPTPVEPSCVSAVHALLSDAVVVVGAELAQIARALDAVYPAQRDRATVVEDALSAAPTELADLPRAFETVPGAYPVSDASNFLDDVLRAGDRRGANFIAFVPQTELVRVCYRTASGTAEAGRISRADWAHLVFPEIIRRGEATGAEFTVEVVRNGGDPAVRIWRSVLTA